MVYSKQLAHTPIKNLNMDKISMFDERLVNKLFTNIYTDYAHNLYIVQSVGVQTEQGDEYLPKSFRVNTREEKIIFSDSTGYYDDDIYFKIDVKEAFETMLAFPQLEERLKKAEAKIISLKRNRK